MQKFSVLMSVYHKERPDFLCASLDSVFNQTAMPSEVILVEDGPLTPELNIVIEKYCTKYRNLKSVPLKHNQGLGRALNEGLQHCSYDLVARMDTDDVCKTNRFEKQLHLFESHPEIDVCSTWMDEFVGEVDNVHTIKRLPETHDDLYEYGKKRNPVNHPSVMFRKKAVQLNGNYQDYPLFEDYFLWIRMLKYGCKFYCIQESLMYFRSSLDVYKRRGGFNYALTEARIQFLLYGLRYINFSRFIKNVVIRFSVRIMPNRLRGFIYHKMRKC